MPARAALTALLAACCLAGCGGGGGHEKSPGELAIGLTEFQPALLAPLDVAQPPRGAAALRERVLALNPRWYRLQVNWSAAQPAPGRPADWERPGTGGYSPAQQLRAAAAARGRPDGGGFEPVVTFLGLPRWAAQAPAGCRSGAPADAGVIAPSALPAYRAMVESLLRLADREGAPIRWWSAWNEPNVNYYLAPQRAKCSVASPSTSAAAYAPLVRELRAALDAAPGEQSLLVGETSDPIRDHPGVTSLDAFARSLPSDVLCLGDAWAQHQYAGDADHLADLEAILRARPCAGRPLPIWMTETGAGREGPDHSRSLDPAVQRASCRAMNDLLARWYRDPQVDTAFQFTFHEDSAFAVGLVSPGYDRTYPTYALWRAWGQRSNPADPPPPLPAACR